MVPPPYPATSLAYAIGQSHATSLRTLGDNMITWENFADSKLLYILITFCEHSVNILLYYIEALTNMKRSRNCIY